jgi:polysaccharide pyruvyl transferase WcaK-like protein
MNVLICGATAWGNKGDDAIRDNIVAVVKEAAPDADVIATRPFVQKGLVEWADKVIIGGGGILYDECQGNFNNYFGVGSYLDHANRLNKPVCICSIGVERFDKPQNIAFLRQQLKTVHHVSVRHRQNAELFERYELHDNVVCGDDIAFLTPRANCRFTNRGTPRACLIPNIKFWNWYDKDDIKWLVGMMKDEGYAMHVATISTEDNGMAREIYGWTGTPWGGGDFLHLNPNELVSLFADMDVVLSGRLHGMILAQCGGAKVYSLSHRYKLSYHVGDHNVLLPHIKSRNKAAILAAFANGGRPQSHGTPFAHVSLLRQFLGGQP